MLPPVSHSQKERLTFLKLRVFFDDGRLKLSVRAALAGYALLRWGVDCSPAHSLDAARHHLWLANPDTLAGVESATLAPGYDATMNGGDTRL